MTKTLLEHTCDQCGEKRILEEINIFRHADPTFEWLNVSQTTYNGSCTFETSKIFCSIKCLYEWAWKQQEVKS